MEGTGLMKIKIHNSLALKANTYNSWTEYLLNKTYLGYSYENLYFYSERSNYPIGSFDKDGSLKYLNCINLAPLNLKMIKSRKWKELQS